MALYIVSNAAIQALDPHRNKSRTTADFRTHPAFADYQYLRTHFARLVGVAPDDVTENDRYDHVVALFAGK